MNPTEPTADELPPVNVEELADVIDSIFGNESIEMARAAIAYFQSHRAASMEPVNLESLAEIIEKTYFKGADFGGTWLDIARAAVTYFNSHRAASMEPVDLAALRKAMQAYRRPIEQARAAVNELCPGRRVLEPFDREKNLQGLSDKLDEIITEEKAEAAAVPVRYFKTDVESYMVDSLGVFYLRQGEWRKSTVYHSVDQLESKANETDNHGNPLIPAVEPPKPDDEWKDECLVELWNHTLGAIGFDTDGDVGIIDDHYSIIFSRKGALQLRDWLNEHIPAQPTADPMALPTDAELDRIKKDWILRNQCRVCENGPDETGTIHHGRGCYTQNVDGGGESYAEDFETGQLIAAARNRNALQKFKDYVHARLDAADVPTDPDSPHKVEGCRIGGRLDVLLADRDNALKTVDRFREDIRQLIDRRNVELAERDTLRGLLREAKEKIKAVPNPVTQKWTNQCFAICATCLKEIDAALGDKP